MQDAREPICANGRPTWRPYRKKAVANATAFFYNTPKPSSNIFKPIKMRTAPPMRSALFL